MNRSHKWLKSQRGFTLIELIVVIAAIGVLAAITVVGFNRYQADTRDTVRASNVSVISEALEKYYDTNGEYPSCSAISSVSTLVTTFTLVGIDDRALVAPEADSETNSIKCASAGNTLTVDGTDFFEYVGDGSSTCNGSGSCLTYTLKYKNEANGEIVSLPSRRVASLASSGNITSLAASATDFDKISLSWSAVSNATSYNIERASDAGFTTSVVATTSSTNSYNSTGLAAATLYYYRVRPVAGSGAVGSWSNTASDTTRSLSTPVLTVTADSNTQITVTWPDISFETDYTLQYNTSGPSSWGSPTTVSPSPAANSTSKVMTGLSTGVTYYFRMQASATGTPTIYSEWSDVKSATTFVPAPTCMVATTASNTSISADWCDVGVATSYKLEYDDNSGFTSPATWSPNPTSSVQVVTGLNAGATYYFRAYALVGATQSLSASPSASATTTISDPTSVYVSSSVPDLVRPYSAGAWVYFPQSPSGNWYYGVGTASGSCAASPGTSIQYLFYANYTSPTTTRGPYGWTTGTQGFMIAPNSPYGVRFTVYARCVGAVLISGTPGYTSGYAY